MVLARQAATSGEPPVIVVAIGGRKAGKTVYLGTLLDVLAQSGPSFGANPKGAFSVELQDMVLGHLGHRSFPPGSPTEPNRWHWAHYEVPHPKSRARLDLVTPEISGAALEAEIETPGTHPIFRFLFGRAAGLILCIDAAEAAEGIVRPDLFAMKAISHLDATIENKRKDQVRTPLAIVLCKSDLCPDAFEKPDQFVASNLSRLWGACHARFEHVEFFATSVVGSMGYAVNPENPADVAPVPLHVSPQRVLEPLEWLLSHC